MQRAIPKGKYSIPNPADINEFHWISAEHTWVAFDKNKKLV